MESSNDRCGFEQITALIALEPEKFAFWPPAHALDLEMHAWGVVNPPLRLTSGVRLVSFGNEHHTTRAPG